MKGSAVSLHSVSATHIGGAIQQSMFRTEYTKEVTCGKRKLTSRTRVDIEHYSHRYISFRYHPVDEVTKTLHEVSCDHGVSIRKSARRQPCELSKPRSACACLSSMHPILSFTKSKVTVKMHKGCTFVLLWFKDNVFSAFARRRVVVCKPPLSLSHLSIHHTSSITSSVCQQPHSFTHADSTKMASYRGTPISELREQYVSMRKP
jgi:hypothetical protein